MMSREDAIRIAETATAIRPDWLRTSIVTVLADFRDRQPRDVHLAMVWVAYDPATKTPARLREDGPWWHLASTRQPGVAPALPAWHDRYADTPKATPEQIAAIRAARKDAT
ncbi:hypothetical protein H5399_05140 [Tessaracoccus sp. MC1627]|uniref:hypothetical protein n=1 Tax=Tessaracoccus sp. MC1627 TaxID=2760312 RepID=UPI001601C74C|nr:hypothetical protein [Tessaracoccus sp. MC1627]MBB1511989.1 hypothetical protein [Tessaracoccus sp. MC1627]